MADSWKTEDGYVFTLQPDGTVSDGDMSWPSTKDFFDSMRDNDIKFRKISGETDTSKLKKNLRSSKDKKFKGHTTYRT